MKAVFIDCSEKNPFKYLFKLYAFGNVSFGLGSGEVFYKTMVIISIYDSSSEDSLNLFELAVLVKKRDFVTAVQVMRLCESKRS